MRSISLAVKCYSAENHLLNEWARVGIISVCIKKKKYKIQILISPALAAFFIFIIRYATRL